MKSSLSFPAYPFLALSLLMQVAFAAPALDDDAQQPDFVVEWEPNGELPAQQRDLLGNEDFLKQLDADRFKILANQLMRERLRLDRNPTRDEDDTVCDLIHYWSLIDQEGVMDFIATMRGGDFRFSVILDATSSMSWNDPEGALAKTSRFRDPELRDFFRIKLTRALTQSNGELWLKWVTEDPKLGEDSETPYINGWLAEDVGRFEKLPPSVQNVVLAGFSHALAAKDRDAAIAWAREWKPVSMQMRMLRFIKAEREAPRKNPRELPPALEEAKGRLWTDQNPDPATALKDFTQADREKIVLSLLDSPRPRDPWFRIKLIGTLPQERLTEALTLLVVTDLAEIDPVAAFGRISSLRTTSGRTQAYWKVFKEWSKKDRAAALAKLPEVPGSYRRNVLDAISSPSVGQQARDPMVTLKWAIKEPGAETSVVSMVLAANSWPQPDEAIRIFENMPGKDDPRMAPLVNDAATNLASLWWQKEPAKATEWVLSFPDEDRREYLLGRLAAHIRASKPVTVADWFASCPEGAARDSARIGWAMRLAEEDPAEALATLGEVADTERRRRAAFRLVDARPDRKALWRKAVESSALVPDLRQALVKHLQ